MTKELVNEKVTKQNGSRDAIPTPCGRGSGCVSEASYNHRGGVNVSIDSQNPSPQPSPARRSIRRGEGACHNNSGTPQRLINVKNLFAYSPIRLFALKRAAFTLAEVLIALGVIGIVAAMTIPNLVQSYKKKVVETRLVKFYSTINQAISLAEIDYGNKTGWMVDDVDVLWDKYLKPYMKYTKEETINNFVLTGGDRKFKRVYLSDGSVFVFDMYHHDTYGGHFYFCPFEKDCTSDNVDTPDYISKIFRFGFWPNESHERFKYHKNKGVEPYLVNWDGKEASLYTNKDIGCNKTAEGMFCTEVIRRNGWKIPDDYPFKF